MDVVIIMPRRQKKTCLWGFRTCDNNFAEQPVYPGRMLSVIVIRLLESVISELAIGEISFF